MKIYNLYIISTEDTKEINENTHLHQDEYGYYTTLENVKKAIIEKMNEIKEDMEEYPEFVQRIYCDEIELDIAFPDYIRLIFNEDGDMIHRHIENQEIKNPIYKIGDFVTVYENGKNIKIGVIVDIPTHDSCYTIYYSEDDEFMDHKHLEEEWLYKVDNVSNELRKKLNNILKACIGNKDYQFLKREEKLKNIVK